MQEQELLEAARKIARVAEDLAAMQRAGAALGVHKCVAYVQFTHGSNSTHKYWHPPRQPLI